MPYSVFLFMNSSCPMSFLQMKETARIEIIVNTRYKTFNEKNLIITLAAKRVTELKHLVIVEDKEVKDEIFSSFTFRLYIVCK